MIPAVNATAAAGFAAAGGLDWAGLATPAAVFLSFGLTVFLVHRRFDRFEDRLAVFEAAHTECRIGLARDYATRGDLERVAKRVDGHAERIARLECPRGGSLEHDA